MTEQLSSKNDLLRRLRSGTYIEGDETAIHEEAADAIERLTRERHQLAEAHELLRHERNRLTREVEARAEKLDCALAREIELRAALEDACQTFAVHGDQPPAKWLEALRGAAETAVVTEKQTAPDGSHFVCPSCGVRLSFKTESYPTDFNGDPIKPKGL